MVVLVDNVYDHSCGVVLGRGGAVTGVHCDVVTRRRLAVQRLGGGYLPRARVDPEHVVSDAARDVVSRVAVGAWKEVVRSVYMYWCHHRY